MRFIPLLAIATAVAAVAVPNDGGTSVCSNGGTQECCNSVQSSDTSYVTTLLSLLGLQVPSGTLVGLGCTWTPSAAWFLLFSHKSLVAGAPTERHIRHRALC